MSSEEVVLTTIVSKILITLDSKQFRLVLESSERQLEVINSIAIIHCRLDTPIFSRNRDFKVPTGFLSDR